jgi:hypothetical protein
MTINWLLHTQRARRAWPILVRRAAGGHAPLTYGDLCRPLRLHPRSARWFLSVIQDYCRTHGDPPLQAMAVNKKTKIPGVGYAGSARTRTAHASQVRRVMAHSWPSRAPF